MGEQPATDAGLNSDPHHRGGERSGVAHRTSGGVPASEHGTRLLQQCLTRGGQGHVAVVAHDQGDPKITLELADLTRQRRLGDEQPLGGASEVRHARRRPLMVHIVTTARVRFPGADGATLVDDLYRPADIEGSAPALVVTGSWLTV